VQRKNFLIHSLAMAAALLAGSVSAQTVKLTLAHGTALDNPRHTASLKFAEAVKAKSNGRIEVTVAGAAQLGDDAAMVTALRTGALDMSANSQGAVANVVPEYAAFGMPFLFSSQAHAWRVMDGPAGQELAEKSADKGLIVLGYWDNGIRQMSNSKRPLLKPADLKGLKMRSVGGIPQNIPAGEVYQALERGTVDAAEWVGPYDDERLGLAKAAPNYYFPGWQEGSGQISFYVNQQKFDALVPEYKALIEMATQAATLLTLSRYDHSNPAALVRLVTAGAKVRQFPKDVLAGLRTAATEVMDERAASHAGFKRLFDSYRKYQADMQTWWRLGEMSYDNMNL